MPVMQAEKRKEKRWYCNETDLSAHIGDISCAVGDISREGFSFFHAASLRPHATPFQIGACLSNISLRQGNDIIATVTFYVVNKTTVDGKIRYGCAFSSAAAASTFEYDFDDAARFFAISSNSFFVTSLSITKASA